MFRETVDHEIGTNNDLTHDLGDGHDDPDSDEYEELEPYEKLVPPHREMMLAYACRFLRHDVAAAEDVVQDSLLRAFRGWHLFRVRIGDPIEASVRGWLLRVVASAFVERYRREKRLARIADLKTDYLMTMHGVQREEDVFVSPETVELGDECSQAIAGLAPERAEIVRRVDLLGHSYKRVSADLGIPIGSVMSRLHRAREDLRHQLGGYASKEYGFGDHVGKRAFRGRGD